MRRRMGGGGRNEGETDQTYIYVTHIHVFTLYIKVFTSLGAPSITHRGPGSLILL